MKKQTRFGIFETNSSSTHVMCITTQDVYNRWTSGNGNMYMPFKNYRPLFEDGYKPEKGKIYSKEELKELLRHYKYFNLSEEDQKDEDKWNELISNVGFYTYDDWCDEEYLEFFEEKYVSPSGDKIVALGKYGNEY